MAKLKLIKTINGKEFQFADFVENKKEASELAKELRIMEGMARIFKYKNGFNIFCLVDNYDYYKNKDIDNTYIA